MGTPHGFIIYFLGFFFPCSALMAAKYGSKRYGWYSFVPQQWSNEDICFHMVFDTHHQKFGVVLSNLVHHCRTASDFLIDSDKSLTVFEVKSIHDKGQAKAAYVSCSSPWLT